MSKEYDIEVYTQPSLYKPVDRTMKVYFSEPDVGVNEETGLLLFIAGYGGEANSNVYKKMRSLFADQYNMITIQCNYFGWEFMQSKREIEFDKSALNGHFDAATIELIADDFTKYRYLLSGKELTIDVSLNETLDNFNDMGIIQAMDNLIALKVVSDILEDNEYTFNKKKVILYGQSHGAYIAYVCNALMPNAFSAIIDNSSYLYPRFSETEREVILTSKYNYSVVYKYSYLLQKVMIDRQIYDLNYLYKHVDNRAQIIAFYGIDDSMTSVEDKMLFLSSMRNVASEVVDEKRIDNATFKTTKHGLGADFIKLFEYVMKNYVIESKEERLQFENREINTDSFTYKINNEKGIPIMDFWIRHK